MRGFAMLMVVWGHVSMFDNIHGLETIMWHFAMPLFFFISGFVSYRAGKVWNAGALLTFFKRKVPVLLIFPFLCLCACSLITRQCGIVDALWHNQKMGYWFVFTLFQCNLLYIILQMVLQRVRGKYVSDILLFAFAAALFLATRILWKYFGVGSDALTEGSRSIAGLVSWMSLGGNFQWFACGVVARRHYSAFTRLLTNNIVLIFCIVAMIALSLQSSENAFTSVLANYFSTVLVLSFFNRHQQHFTAERKMGRLMQYIGRRTLDIYLLHYFFWYTSDFTVFSSFYHESPVLKLIITMSFAICVTALSLLAGNVLRLSSFLARYGFGGEKF